MKKVIIPTLLALILGIIMAKIVFNQYETEPIQTVFKENETINILQIGVYSNKDSLKENTKNLENYIYEKKNDLYYVYVGMTKNEENLNKLKKYYKNQGYEIYVKKLVINNKKFLKCLDEYDKIMLKISDEDSINIITNKIIKKYEEYVL